MGKTCENCIHFCVCVYRDGTQIIASRCAFYDQNKRPRGEWIITGKEHGALGLVYKIKRCSNCGFEHSLLIPENFCPKCGSDNRKRGEKG